MIEIQLTCLSKNASLIDGSVMTEVIFGTSNNLTHQKGAVIGVPSTKTLTLNQDSQYNIVSGNITILIKEEKQANQYKVGTVYTLKIDNTSKPVKK